MLVPIVCGGDFKVTLVFRMLVGLFESASFPAVYNFFTGWIPIEERTILIPFVFSGIYFGEMFGFLLSGLLVDSIVMVGGHNIAGWQSLFYVFGIAGVIWAPFWAILAYELPEHHPRIQRSELKLILQGS